MLIHNRTFGGERPKTGHRNINSNEAKVALDCDLYSQELRALNKSKLVNTTSIKNPGTLVYFKDRFFTMEEALSISEYNDRLFWTGSMGPRQADHNSMILGNSYAMGVPSPALPEATVSGTGSGQNTISTSILVTFVNKWGEEGDKSEVTELFDIEPGQRILIEGINYGNQANWYDIEEHGIVSSRIYLLHEGAFKFIHELTLDRSAYSYVYTGEVLGESFSTDDYDAPPSDMEGLHIMANGVALGFTSHDNMVYVSEPGQPNAWRNFFPVKDKPVALSSYDNTAVIMTDGFPEVATIHDPDNVIPVQLTYREPCVSSRSVVQGAGGVLYASVNGVFYISAGGGRNLTEDYLDNKDWIKYAPSSMVSGWKDGQYIAFHKGQKEGNAFVFDTRESNAIIRQLSAKASAVWTEPGTNNLYYTSNYDILHMEGSEEKLTYTWQSKTLGDGSPFALSSYRVLTPTQVMHDYKRASDKYSLTIDQRAEVISTSDDLSGALNQQTFASLGTWGAINSGVEDSAGNLIESNMSLELSVSGDGKTIDVKQVTSEIPNRLKYATRRRYWEYTLTGTIDLQQIDLASSNGEMYTGA